jgi:hypothetical protein
MSGCATLSFSDRSFLCGIVMHFNDLTFSISENVQVADVLSAFEELCNIAGHDQGHLILCWCYRAAVFFCTFSPVHLARLAQRLTVCVMSAI